MSREISPLRLGADTFFVSAFSPTCPIKGNVQRNISPSARCRHFFCLGIQPNLFGRALSSREWSCSGRVAYFVPALEAQERFLFPVVPYPCCDGAIRF